MKLYWRYKKNGKWTWKPATVTAVTVQGHIVQPLSVFMHKNDRGYLDEKATNAVVGTALGRVDAGGKGSGGRARGARAGSAGEFRGAQ